MTIDLTPIIQAGIFLLAALVTYRLIPWIKARTTESQQALMESVLYGLVAAADNLHRQGRVTDKLVWVLDQMREKGFDIDIATIESAVAELFPHKGKGGENVEITD